MATADLLAPPSAAPRRNPTPRLWTPDEFARMQQLGLFAGRDVELANGTVVERPGGTPFMFTRKEYYALGDNHFFRDQRVQLIGGVILQESPMNPPHATTVSLGQFVLPTLFGAGFYVRVQLPLDLGLISEPHPDLAVVTGSPRDYLIDHPKTALLVVEVSDTTIEEDTHDKASLYASGGIEVLGHRPDDRPRTGVPFAEAGSELEVRDELRVVDRLRSQRQTHAARGIERSRACQ